MKKLFIFITIFNIFAYSYILAEDFEIGVGINIPLGASIGYSDTRFKLGVDDYTKKYGTLKSDASFEGGISVLPGAYLGFDKFMGFSIALDLGYYRDAYSYKETISTVNGDKNIKTSYSFDTINIGMIPKLNVANFFIGIGGGVKLPISGSINTQVYNASYESLEDVSYGFGYKGFKNRFESVVIPYLKVTVDYLIHFNDQVALGFGFYLGYDFELKEKTDGLIFSKKALSSLDIGGQISLYIVND